MMSTREHTSLHIGQNVRRENDGMIARQAFDEAARFHALRWVEPADGSSK
jgi:hypothetical protein